MILFLFISFLHLQADEQCLLCKPTPGPTQTTSQQVCESIQASKHFQKQCASFPKAEWKSCDPNAPTSKRMSIAKCFQGTAEATKDFVFDIGSLLKKGGEAIVEGAIVAKDEMLAYIKEHGRSAPLSLLKSLKPILSYIFTDAAANASKTSLQLAKQNLNFVVHMVTEEDIRERFVEKVMSGLRSLESIYWQLVEKESSVMDCLNPEAYTKRACNILFSMMVPPAIFFKIVGKLIDIKKGKMAVEDFTDKDFKLAVSKGKLNQNMLPKDAVERLEKEDITKFTRLKQSYDSNLHQLSVISSSDKNIKKLLDDNIKFAQEALSLSGVKTKKKFRTPNKREKRSGVKKVPYLEVEDSELNNLMGRLLRNRNAKMSKSEINNLWSKIQTKLGRKQPIEAGGIKKVHLDPFKFSNSPDGGMYTVGHGALSFARLDFFISDDPIRNSVILHEARHAVRESKVKRGINYSGISFTPKDHRFSATDVKGYENYFSADEVSTHAYEMQYNLKLLRNELIRKVESGQIARGDDSISDYEESVLEYLNNNFSRYTGFYRSTNKYLPAADKVIRNMSAADQKSFFKRLKKGKPLNIPIVLQGKSLDQEIIVNISDTLSKSIGKLVDKPEQVPSILSRTLNGFVQDIESNHRALDKGFQKMGFSTD